MAFVQDNKKRKDKVDSTAGEPEPTHEDHDHGAHEEGEHGHNVFIPKGNGPYYHVHLNQDGTLNFLHELKGPEVKHKGHLEEVYDRMMARREAQENSSEETKED